MGKSTKSVPRRLEPALICGIYGTTEVVLFQSVLTKGFSAAREARTYQADAYTFQNHGLQRRGAVALVGARR